MKSRPLNLLALLALLVAGLLTACGSDDSGDETAASSGGGGADCTPANEFDTIKEGKLTVVGFELAPYTTFAGGEPDGIDVDVIKEIAENECLELEITELASAAVIPAIQSGRADVAIGDWNRTKEREEIINQTDPMYLDTVGFVSAEGISKPSDLQGKQVASVAGAYWNEELDTFSDSDLKLYQSWGQLYDDLQAGRVDVGVTSYAQAVHTLQEKGGDLKVEQAAADPGFSASTKPGQADLPHTLGNDAMKAALNANIAELKQSGRLAEIVEAWGLDPAIVETGPPTFK
ncbi:MAG: amino acid ABC transporter substrate-binding protein [Solirubrobacterales bacterium]|nr:amino acid ABC transporter substrate-binding protein [Solirubrobacterales bacterium]